jgi:hypothetical protein
MAATPPTIEPLRKIRRLSTVVRMGETPGIVKKAGPFAIQLFRKEAIIMTIYTRDGPMGRDAFLLCVRWVIR